MDKKVHIPVLLHEVVRVLDPQPGNIILDATLGEGGHTKELCRASGGGAFIIGIDRDGGTLERAKAHLKGSQCRVEFVKGNFKNLTSVLEELQVKEVQRVIFDLGMSSVSLEVSGRGFSFLKNEPLLMTYDEKVSGLTAQEIVNEWNEEQIETILRGYGEERFSRQIAKTIVKRRKEKTIETTFDLVEVIKEAVPAWYRRRKVHPATKTFQALRITVNDEIGAIEDGLTQGFEALSTDGRLAAITFHSLEDRTVKKLMKSWEVDKKGRSLLSKPLSPSREEIKNNPRSRSAKLRCIQKF